MINVEVSREPNESSSSLIRRFSKRLQGSNVVRRAKGLKERERPLSGFKKRQRALKRLTRRAEIEHLRKLGKLPPANAPYQNQR